MKIMRKKSNEPLLPESENATPQRDIYCNTTFAIIHSISNLGAPPRGGQVRLFQLFKFRVNYHLTQCASNLSA